MNDDVSIETYAQERHHARHRCTVCNHGLDAWDLQDQRTGVVTTEYRHGYLPPSIAPHEPVPEVIEDQHDVRAVCDFCMAYVAQAETWVIPARSFTVKHLGMKDFTSVEDWACCTLCLADYNRRRWTKIMLRWMQNTERTDLTAIERSWLTTLWSGLRDHQSGDPRLEHTVHPTDGQHR